MKKAILIILILLEFYGFMWLSNYAIESLFTIVIYKEILEFISLILGLSQMAFIAYFVSEKLQLNIKQ